MALKLGNQVGEKAVWAVTDQPSPVLSMVTIKKKGGSISLVPERRRLVKTMAFLSIVEFVGSIFCGSGDNQPDPANSKYQEFQAEFRPRAAPVDFSGGIAGKNSA